MQAVFERLIAANIRILPISVSNKHVVFERDGYVALVERIEDSFGAIGSAGKLVDKGFASLFWRGDGAFFVAKGFEQPALPDEIDAIRTFQADLESAIRK